MANRLQLLSTNHELDIEEAQPSPPYKRYPSTSQLRLDDLQTPSYDSENDGLMRKGNHPPEVDLAGGAKVPPSKVRYEEPQSRQSTLGYGKMSRVSSGDLLSSRPTSLAGTDDEYDDDDYDWSDEEDLVDEEAKFSKHMGVVSEKKGLTFSRIITFFLSTLIGSTFTAAVIAAGPILLHFFYLDDTEHRRYVTDNVSAWLFWAASNLLISWYLAVIVDIIPIIATWVVSVSWGRVSESMRSNVELYNALKGNIKPVLYAASGWVSWIILFVIIYELFDMDDPHNSRASYTPHVYQAIELLFFLTLVLSLQRLLSQLIAVRFHRTAYKERLDELRTSLKTIDHLREYRPRPNNRSSRHMSSMPLFTMGGNRSSRSFDEHDTDHDADTEGFTSKRGKMKSKSPHPLSQSEPASREQSPARETENAHSYPPKAPTAKGPSRTRVLHTNGHAHGKSEDDKAIVQAVKALKFAVLHDARNLTGKSDHRAISGMSLSINSAHEAKRLAKKIYMAFKADRKRTYLVPQDFYPAYASTEEAEQAFKVFDADNNGDISRAEIKTAVLKAYKERRILSRSLRDVNAALRTLDKLLVLVALIILFFISLSVFDLDVDKSLTSIYSLGIAASFIFKNSASSIFDAIMFLFVTHPFDTGDRVFIDDENFVVKKMGLFATTFTRGDGSETYYFNSQLFNKFITNVRRSGKTFESLTLQVSWLTPLAKLDALEKCMNEWLQTEENRWFEPSTSVTLQKIDYQRSLEFTMGIGHNGTWQDWGLRNARKTAFHAAVKFYCQQLGIRAANSPIPISWCNGPYGGGADMSKLSLATPNYENPPRTPHSGMPVPGTPNTLKPGFPAPMSPTSPGLPMDYATWPNEADREELIEISDFSKPVLGFMPPAEGRELLLRARKSRGKKGGLRAVGADM